MREKYLESKRDMLRNIRGKICDAYLMIMKEICRNCEYRGNCNSCRILRIRILISEIDDEFSILCGDDENG